MDQQELEERIKLSSIPIRSLDENLMPTGLASACICSYAEKRVLLTVQHVTGNMEKWAIQVKYVPGKGTAMQPLGGMNFLESFDINTSTGKKIDFSYVEIPNDIESMSQEIDPRNGSILNEEKRLDSIVDFKAVPNASETYAFSGQVMPEFSGNMFITEQKIYTGLKYIGNEEDYYVFELPSQHPGHDHFEGCSGAPIMDSKGNAVALVCKGNVTTNQIYGISLKKYEIALNVSYGDLSKGT